MDGMQIWLKLEISVMIRISVWIQGAGPK